VRLSFYSGIGSNVPGLCYFCKELVCLKLVNRFEFGLRCLCYLCIRFRQKSLCLWCRIVGFFFWTCQDFSASAF